MNQYISDFLRGGISSAANIILMMILLKPKYSKKITRLAMMGILVADLGTAIFCYISGNLTMLSKIDIALFVVLCFAVRPLFKDNFMQWLFSYLTVQNINYTVIVISFVGSRRLPFPAYSNSLLRIILFGVFIIILSRYIRPLYRQAVEHWNSYFAIALVIYITFNYYVLFSENIVVTLTEQAVPLILMIFLGFAAYGSIFLSMKNLQREFRIKEENRKIQLEQEYLQLAAKNMALRLELIEEVSVESTRVAHDRRHFNNVILKLLEHGEIGEAIALLQSHNEASPKLGKVLCENTVVNAAISHYVSIAEHAGISVDLALDISNDLTVDVLEFSMVVSNLIENAIQACGRLTEKQTPYIRFICRNMGRLLLEMENTCAEGIELDKNGYPISCEKGHGIGSKSVIGFVKKYEGELLYRIENGVFRVRILV